MTKKTAMMEWLEWFEQNRVEIILNIDVAKQKATELLEQEKEQIVEAWWKGDENFNARLTGEDYYTQTYKQL